MFGSSPRAPRLRVRLHRTVSACALPLVAMAAGAQPQAPSGLMVDLLAHPERTTIESPRPSLGWIVEDPTPGAVQGAYQIRVASRPEVLAGGHADVWDSGRVPSRASVAVRYGGPPLTVNAGYAWTVRTWDAQGRPGPWADAQTFRTGALDGTTARYPLVQDAIAGRVVATGAGTFVDFGRDAFGTLQVTLAASAPDSLVVHLGEKLSAPNVIDRSPGGTVRYRRVVVPLQPGTRTYRLQIPPDQRNTGPRQRRRSFH